MKEPDYQQRIHQLEGALRVSEKREASLQGRLEEAEAELGHTMVQVADLQGTVEKVQRSLRRSKGREASLKVRPWGRSIASELIDAKAYRLNIYR